jgi:phytoene dehydrogenase-like protein
MEEEYDAIVIGSGIGGLTTAALLAKAYGQKVLVLEQHWTIGGLTHGFERKTENATYSWDVGVHYIGFIKEGELMSDIYDYISNGQLEWEKIKDPFDTFWYPDFRFGVSSDLTQYKKDLSALFPKEEKAILRYFKHVKAAANWGTFWFLKETLPRPLSWIMALLKKSKQAFFMQTTQAYLDKNFKDPKLKALLSSQWGDYATIPNESTFWGHAMIVYHYSIGGFYPRGGSQTIAQYIVPTIEASGGKCLTSCNVNEILIENGQAIGCTYRVQEKGKWVEKTVHAKNVISSAGARNTFRKLLRTPIHPELDQLKSGHTAMTIYLGLKDNPEEKLGVTGGNFWLFNHYKHNEFINNGGLADSPAQFCFLSFPSLKDPSKKSHTAEIVVFAKYKTFEQWKGTDWQNRGEAYEAYKEKVAQRYIDFVEERFSGFKDLVDYVEVSSPLSLQKFTQRPKGAIYGLDLSKERFDLNCLNAKTSIPNLYLSGADIMIMGLTGAAFGGVITAAKIGSKFGVISLIPKIKADNKKRKEQGKAMKIHL